MNNKRIISLQSNTKVYHKPGCRYVKRIKNSNYIEISKGEVVAAGYHICNYCNSMNHLLNAEKGITNLFERKHNMKFNYINGILYVRTELSCWKLVYSRSAKKIIIYHRNSSDSEIDFQHPDQEKYHRQIDIKYVKNIQNALKYIYEHDKYWMYEKEGRKPNHFSSKKYERQAQKRQKRQSIKKVDEMFRMLEIQNPEYQKISCC